ncbi:zinc-dependent peptidase, partial [Akkermansiaceae bacterium]|nr:zinc-dependent peptidase [Akkermansiaceae bacterium]
MLPTIILGSVALVVFIAVFLLEKSRRARQLALLTQRLTEQQREELVEDFKLFRRIPEDTKIKLEGMILLFVDSKTFEPCGGLEEVTGRIQRLIAAQACLLIVNKSLSAYKNLRTILLYPDAFGYDDRGVRLGESWNNGTVILSQQSVLAGGANDHDGHDVTIHEFAHQLDQANDVGIGLPYLESHGAYKQWGTVFSKAFEKFNDKLEHSKK